MVASVFHFAASHLHADITDTYTFSYRHPTYTYTMPLFTNKEAISYNDKIMCYFRLLLPASDPSVVRERDCCLFCLQIEFYRIYKIKAGVLLYHTLDTTKNRKHQKRFLSNRTFCRNGRMLYSNSLPGFANGVLRIRARPSPAFLLEHHSTRHGESDAWCTTSVPWPSYTHGIDRLTE